MVMSCAVGGRKRVELLSRPSAVPDCPAAADLNFLETLGLLSNTLPEKLRSFFIRRFSSSLAVCSTHLPQLTKIWGRFCESVWFP
jgi:hypothetical protein